MKIFLAMQWKNNDFEDFLVDGIIYLGENSQGCIIKSVYNLGASSCHSIPMLENSAMRDIPTDKLLFFLQNGIPEAYASLFEKFSVVVYWSALIHFCNVNIAKQVTRQTFLQLYPLLQSYKNPQKISRLVHVIATRTIAETASTDDVCQDLEVFHNFADNHRLILVLRYIEGKTLEEISELLGVTMNDVQILDANACKMPNFTQIDFANFQKYQFSQDIDFAKETQKLPMFYPGQNHIKFLVQFLLAILLIPTMFFLLFAQYEEYLRFLLLLFVPGVAVCTAVFLVAYSISQRKHRKIVNQWKSQSLVLCLLLFGSACYGDVKILSGVSDTQVAVDKTFDYTIMVAGNAHVSPPKLTEYDNVKIISGPKTVVKAEPTCIEKIITRYQYKMQALQPGVVYIGKATIHHQGTTIESAPIQLQAQQQIPASNYHQKIFFSVERSAFRIYQLQSFVVDIVCWKEQNLNLHDLQYFPPDFPKDVAVAKYQAPDEYLARNGYIYRTTRYSYLLQIAKPGKFSLAPAKLTALEYLESDKPNRFEEAFGNDPFFDDDFFKKKPIGEAFAGEKKTVEITSPQEILEILPLPQDKQVYGVGKFQAQTSVNQQQVYIQSPLQQIISFSGKGNLQSLSLPLYQSQDFEISSPIVVEQRYLDHYGNLRKVFKVQLVPVKAGNLQIPSLFFRYFDPEEAKYHEIHVLGPQIHVMKE